MLSFGHVINAHCNNMAATTPVKHVVVDAGGFIRNAPIRVTVYVLISKTASVNGFH